MDGEGAKLLQPMVQWLAKQAKQETESSVKRTKKASAAPVGQGGPPAKKPRASKP